MNVPSSVPIVQQEKSPMKYETRENIRVSLSICLPPHHQICAKTIYIMINANLP